MSRTQLTGLIFVTILGLIALAGYALWHANVVTILNFGLIAGALAALTIVAGALVYLWLLAGLIAEALWGRE